MIPFFSQKGRPSSLGRTAGWCFLALYLLALALMCFTPQHGLTTFETPGIQRFGRVVVLLVPFNSLIHFTHLPNWQAAVWVIGQNIVNIFLLFPLVFICLFLFPRLRKGRHVLLASFLISLGIECTQILADLLYDANRVFELDDLWTNTLGGVLAWIAYRHVQKHFLHKRK